MGRRNKNKRRKSYYFYDPVKTNKSYSRGYSYYTMPQVSAEKIDIRRIDVFGQSRYWTPDTDGEVCEHR